MLAKVKVTLFSPRVILSIVFLAVTLGGLLYTNKAQPLRQPVLATCQNQALWPTKHLENATSCPLSPDSQTITTFWNSENLDNNKELIAGLVVKVHANLIEPAYTAKIQIDSALVTVDKKTHKVVDKKFTKFSKHYGTRFNEETEISQEVPLTGVTMNKDYYYRFEVYDLRVYLVRYDFRYRVDYFKNKKFLVNAWFSTSDFTPFSRIRQFQQPEFIILILLSLYFIYRLLFVDYRRLISPFAWLAILNTVAAGIYLWPGHIEHVRPMYAFLAFQFVTNITVDFFIFGKSLFKPFNTLLPFICFFLNIVMIGFWKIAMRDTYMESYPVDQEFRVDVSKEFQNNVQNLLKIKFILHIIALVIGALRGPQVTRTFYNLIPVFFGVSAWVTSMEKTEGPYMEDEKNPFRIYLDFAFVPVVIFILQLTAVDSDKGYFMIPPAEEAEYPHKLYPLDKILSFAKSVAARIPIVKRFVSN